MMEETKVRLIVRDEAPALLGRGQEMLIVLRVLQTTFPRCDHSITTGAK